MYLVLSWARIANAEELEEMDRYIETLKPVSHIARDSYC